MESASFSTGQIFGYWSDWKEDTKEPDGKDRDIFNGYSRSELYIKPRSKDLKEEVVGSGLLENGLKEWLLHLYKAQQYINTVKVKNMESNHREPYGIKEGTAISLSGILSIILYCDTNTFQNKASLSFRKKSVFETIYSLKKRHTKFYWFSKNIIQAISVYGIDGDDGMDEYEVGPFYCGLSCVLSVGAFAILLKAPTSTTKDIEIAINFATRDGIIMEIQNDTGWAFEQRMFDCSWISNYSEENERLWVGYYNMKRLRISSIRIIETAHNHISFFTALHIFDQILSGEWISDETKVDKMSINMERFFLVP